MLVGSGRKLVTVLWPVKKADSVLRVEKEGICTLSTPVPLQYGTRKQDHVEKLTWIQNAVCKKIS